MKTTPIMPEQGGTFSLRPDAPDFVPSHNEDTYGLEDNLFGITCNTRVFSSPENGIQDAVAVTNLLADENWPRRIQLTILTGARLQQIGNVADWFYNVFGKGLFRLQHVRLCILRSGEIVSDKVIGHHFTIPEIDFENFKPLKDFFSSFLEYIPVHCDVSFEDPDNEMGLREQFLAMASGSHRAALDISDDKGVMTYSELLNGAMLCRIATQFTDRVGMKVSVASVCQNPVQEALRSNPTQLYYNMHTAWLTNQQAFHQNGSVNTNIGMQQYHTNPADTDSTLYNWTYYKNDGTEPRSYYGMFAYQPAPQYLPYDTTGYYNQGNQYPLSTQQMNPYTAWNGWNQNHGGGTVAPSSDSWGSYDGYGSTRSRGQRDRNNGNGHYQHRQKFYKRAGNNHKRKRSTAEDQHNSLKR